ncbi:MAG: energy transducer TonB [Pseudohongiellaceae bacterium]
MNKFTSIVLISLLAVQLGQVHGAEMPELQRSQEMLREIQRISVEIERIESESGPYSGDLLSPLQSLVELNQTENDFQEVARLQARQLQIMRAELGLDHSDNIALVESIAATNIRLGAWEQVADNLEHIRYLQGVNSAGKPELLLKAVATQASWLMAQTVVGENRRRPRELLKARELFDELKDLAEDAYGEDSPEMAPWLYARALHLYKLVAILNSRNGLASDTLERLIQVDGVGRLQAYNSRAGLFNTFQFGRNNQVPVLDGDSLVGEAYLRDGLSELRQISENFEAQGNIEAQAMAEIYSGDFRVLTDLGSGRKSYNKARDLLLEVGISQQRVTDFFSHPQVIPKEKFVTSFAEAEELQKKAFRTSISEEGGLVLEFVAQQEDAPTVAMSSDYSDRWGFEIPSDFVEMSFTVSSRGVVSSADFLAATSNDKGLRRKAMRAVRGLKFRPRFEGEKSVRTKAVRLQYRVEEDPR